MSTPLAETMGGIGGSMDIDQEMISFHDNTELSNRTKIPHQS